MDVMVLEAQKWLNETYAGKNGYTVIEENGKTGQVTVKALITALQIEIGVTTPNGTFGPQTMSLCPTLSKNVDSAADNKVKILQYGLFCKGYSTSYVTGIFGDYTETAVKKVESDAGFDETGIVTPLLFKAILNTDPLVLASNGDAEIRYIQQMLNKKYHNYIGIIPTNGLYERNTNKALIYALQVEEGIGNIANGNFGPSTQAKCPVLEINDSRTEFVKIVQYALKCNGMEVDNYDGVFNNAIANSVVAFRYFMALNHSISTVDLDVWMSLLTSCGNTSRTVTGCDCATVITKDNVHVLLVNGYNVIGRYLTGRYKLTADELAVLAKYNIKVFPIFQRSGEGISATSVDYFTEERATLDATDAYNAAVGLKFPSNTIIYFAVDYDVYDYQVTDVLIPFYKKLKEQFTLINKKGYRIGIYGPRNVCSRIGNVGYTVSSFVSDMSTGYSGNLGYPMPQNWAFDQITTVTISSEDGESVEIDKDVVRGTYFGEIVADGISYDEASERALGVVGAFEGNDGYANIAGNFDSNGLSLGILQFNIGKGTLQPLLSKMLEGHFGNVVRIFGESKAAELEEMLELPLSEQLAWAISINNAENNIKEEWRVPLQALGIDYDFICIQNEAVAEIMDKAAERCNLFGFNTCRSLTLMFNISVNNGGFMQAEFDEIQSKITSDMTDIEKMTIISKCMGDFRNEDTRVRCLCITNGTGTVHGKTYNLLEEYEISDEEIYNLPDSI